MSLSTPPVIQYFEPPINRTMDQVPRNWIALPQNGGYIIKDVRKVTHCESDGNYSIIHTEEGGRYTVCRKLKEIEAMLPARCFVRIHHCFLVNLCHVKKYHKGEGGQVELKNDKRLDVSRRKKQGFLDRLIMI